MKHILFLALLLFSVITSAQSTQYVWAKSGLTLRSEGNLNAEKINIIPYGAQVATSGNQAEVIGVPTLPARRFKIGDGPDNYLGSQSFTMHDSFEYVKFGDATGYVFGAYLLPFPPPPAELERLELKDWINQLKGRAIDFREQDEGRISAKVFTYLGGMVLTEKRGDLRQVTSIAIPLISLSQAYVIADRLFALETAIKWKEEDTDEGDDYFYTTLKTDDRTYLNFSTFNANFQINIVGGFAVITQVDEW
jgi:hypothetical protein